MLYKVMCQVETQLNKVKIKVPLGLIQVNSLSNQIVRMESSNKNVRVEATREGIKTVSIINSEVERTIMVVNITTRLVVNNLTAALRTQLKSGSMMARSNSSMSSVRPKTQVSLI